MNVVVVAGRLGRDPETRDANGKMVASFSVASNEGRDKTEWHRVTAWEKTAELVGEYCQKGSFVIVLGRLQTRKYTDKQGVEKYSTEIVANRVEFGPKQDGGNSGSNSDIPF